LLSLEYKTVGRQTSSYATQQTNDDVVVISQSVVRIRNDRAKLNWKQNNNSGFCNLLKKTLLIAVKV